MQTANEIGNKTEEIDVKFVTIFQQVSIKLLWLNLSNQTKPIRFNSDLIHWSHWIIFHLKSIVSEISYKVKTKVITADFSKGKEIYRHIEEHLQGIPVGILGKHLPNSLTNSL